MKQYNNIKLAHGPSKIPPIHVLLKFLREYFTEDNDIEVWRPTDWVPEPSVIRSIADPRFKQLASHINSMWIALGRKTNENIKQYRDRHSIVYLKNGFIINSPQTEEMIYSDSYWILRGLLVCEMHNTVKGILENFVSLLDQYGYVPKSNRIYHQDQTQLPMLIMMIDEYVQTTGDHSFIKDKIQILEKEMMYWKNERALPVTVNNVAYTLYRYKANGVGPRPEFYRSDYKYLSNQLQASSILSGLRAAEESRWMNSSRWIDLLGENEGTVQDISTENIIPVDLNAVLHKNNVILSTWFDMMGDHKKRDYYKQAADDLLQSIHEVLWQKNLGIWCDYNYATSEPRRYHYLSNFTPIWTGSYTADKAGLAVRLLQYISDHKLHEYPGGVPDSMEFSGEPWDFPNVHPAIIAIFIEGLASLQDKRSNAIAFLLAEMWIDCVNKGFMDKQLIFNKYNCLKKGGHPAENDKEMLQSGYGVTNGVIMYFMSKWGAILKSSDPEEDTSNPSPVIESLLSKEEKLN